MTLKAIMHRVSKTRASFGAYRENLNEDRHTARHEDVARWLDSGNIRLIRIFAGVPWRGASNNSGVIENVVFQGLWALGLRHLRKWGQHYYILLVPCCVSTDPKTCDLEWPWNLEWPFYVKFSLLRADLESYYLLIYYKVCLRNTWPAEMCGKGVADRDPQNSWNLRKNCMCGPPY